MARNGDSKQRASKSAAVSLDADLARIASLTIDELRVEWRTCIGAVPPSALSKDLLARALAHRVQEKAQGRLAPGRRRELDRLSKGGQATLRRIKIGSVLVREYEGKLHEVYVVADGFSWQGDTYESLSTIARRITGTKWNGPRFFGLRGRKTGPTEGVRIQPDASGRRIAVQASNVAQSGSSRSFLENPE